MNLIDRYFRTLRLFLPRNERDDIVRELSEEIASQIADKEATLGRPLTADEQGAILSQYGHPLLTAARYRPQRHLIGPVIFPYYWIALKLALALVAVTHVVGAMVLVAGGASFVQLGEVVESAAGNALKVIGWTTALAAFFDFCLSRSRVLEKWDPRSGFPAGVAGQTVERALESVPRAARKADRSTPWSAEGSSVGGLVVAIVISAWWLAGLKVPSLFFGPGASEIGWGPDMDRLYPVLVVAQLTMLIEHVARLKRPEGTGIFRALKVVWLIAGWTLIYLVATSGHQWMVWHGEAAARAHATTIMHVAGRDISLADFVNDVWSIVFILVAIAGVWKSLKALVRRVRGIPTAVHA